MHRYFMDKHRVIHTLDTDRDTCTLNEVWTGHEYHIVIYYRVRDFDRHGHYDETKVVYGLYNSLHDLADDIEGKQ